MFNWGIGILIASLVFLVNSASAEINNACTDCNSKTHLPNIDKPFVKIEFNSQSYSWSSGIFINIDAPSWNTDKNKLDTIGDDLQHPIRISTKNHFIEPFPFTETDVDSGKFYAQLRCTGFLHDADGDGLPEMEPLTFWVSSKMSAIECDRDDTITISFKVTDDLTVVKSAVIKWNEAQVKFEKPIYQSDEIVEFTVIEPDMTLLPFPPLATRSSVKVHVYSDSDSAGTIVTAMETAINSGVFVGHVNLSQNKRSNADRLYALPGDRIFVEYTDGTLPKPYSLKDTKDIVAHADVFELDSATYSIKVKDILLQNEFGQDIITHGTSPSIKMSLGNHKNQVQDYVCFFKILDENGVVLELSWVSGIIPPIGNVNLIQPLKIEDFGTFNVEIYLWDSISNAIPISEKRYAELVVTK